MKRTGNLFKTTFTMDNLFLAYQKAKKNCNNKKASFEFGLSLGSNLELLHQQIYDGTYTLMPYNQFTIYEPKKRIIYAPHFRDSVVQHAIYAVIYPIFNRTFINTSFACRKGMGTHSASNYTQKALRAYSSESYLLQLDIKKFFYSIDRDVLRHLIARKIKGKAMIDTMMLFADMDTEDGIPIGNLLSQLYALIYLNPLDHFIKRKLKIQHYVRYVDDFILIGLERDECLLYRKMIIEFLKCNLGLKLSKSTIQKIKKGVNFVGYRTWKAKRYIRKYSLYKFSKMVKQGNQKATVSLLGHAKNTNSLSYMLDIIKKEGRNVIKIPKNYRRIYYPYYGYA